MLRPWARADDVPFGAFRELDRLIYVFLLTADTRTQFRSGRLFGSLVDRIYDEAISTEKQDPLPSVDRTSILWPRDAAA